MHKLVVGSIIFLCLLPALAAANNDDLSKRVAALEGNTGQGLGGKIQFSGEIEAEASYSKQEHGDNNSDIDLTTFGLGVDVILTDYAAGFVLVKWEDDEDDVFIDEGGITLGNVDDLGASLTVGKLYVPFGVFETALVSDPITLDLGETREGAAVVDFAVNGFYGAVYTFSSEINDDSSDDLIDAFGAMAGYGYETDSFSADLTLGYISNITSSGGFVDYLEDASVANVDDYSGGLSVSAVVSVADFTLIGEYVATLDNDYLASEDEEPVAWNVELDYNFEIAGYASTLALSYQGSDEAENVLELPETRIAAALGVEIIDGFGVALEVLRDEDYAGNETDVVTCQLALEF